MTHTVIQNAANRNMPVIFSLEEPRRKEPREIGHRAVCGSRVATLPPRRIYGLKRAKASFSVFVIAVRALHCSMILLVQESAYLKQ